MKLRWMPLYVPDYRAKTAHLSALEHGVYLLLIMHYWQTGGLPDSDEKLARICCCTRTEFRRVKPTVEAFFLPGWKHERIDEELVKAREISGKRSNAAEEKHALAPPPDPASAHASAEQKHTPLPSPLPSQREDRIILKLGEARCDASKPPPSHCKTTKGRDRIYVRRGSAEWDAYAADYRTARGEEPNVNSDGGRWFKYLGEA